MLKLTKKIEYSLIALKHMRLNDGRVSTAIEMANLYQIPRELLAKILQQLTRVGYISSIQGPSGGYELSRSPKDINFIDLIKTIEGDVGIIDCFSNEEDDCVRIDSCTIRKPMLKINKHLRDFFNNISLEDIFKGNLS